MDKELKKALERIDALVGKRHGFSTPDDYFDTLDDAIEARIHSESFPKETGYTAPDNYFANFETELHASISEDAIPKNTGFNTPEKYFSNFENELLAKINSEEFPKETGFINPENYFTDIEENLIAAVPKERSKKKLRNLVIPFVSSAAAILVLYFGFNRPQENMEVNFDALTVTEINEWIKDGNMDVNSYDIASIDATVLNSASFIYEDISDEELNDYLDTVDPEYLYN